MYEDMAAPPLPPSNKLKRYIPGQKQAASLVPPDELTLTELVDGFSALFPLRVRVTKGYCGEHEESSAIAVDDLYNLHFVKRAKVVSISDTIGSKYVVPVNSAAKFGLIQEAGIRVYDTVEDIMNASKLPQIVAVRAGYVGEDSKSSVFRNEILAVRGVVKGSGRFKISRDSRLKVFSITNNMEKILPKEVFGRFSTDPFCTQIYLLEFLENIEDPAPNKVKLFLDFEIEQDLPDHVIAEEMSLDLIYMETSVIASSLSEDDLNAPPMSIKEYGSNTLTIPITLDIEVSVILSPEDYNDKNLTEETRLLLSNFDPTAVRHIEGMAEDDDSDNIYSYSSHDQFFRRIRAGFEREGLEIDTPNKLKKLVPSCDKNQQEVEGSDDDDDSHEYIEIDEELPQIFPPLPPKVAEKKKKARLLPEQPTLDSPHQQVTPDKSGPCVAKHVSSIQKMFNYAAYTQSYSEPVNDFQKPISTHQRQADESIPSPRRHVTMSLPTRLSPSRTVEEVGDSNCKKGEFPSVEMQSPNKEKGRPGTPGSLQERLNVFIARVEVLEKTQQQPRGNKTLEKQVRELESVKQFRDKIEKLEKQVEDLEKKVDEVMKTLSCQGLEDQETAKGGGGAGGSNISLKHLDTAQVVELLQLMNLSKYQKFFQEQNIDGAILANCDDEILKNELCVSSKLDRLRFFLVISGKKSVADFYKKSYVTFTHGQS